METFLPNLLIFAAGIVAGAILVWLLLPARRQHRELTRERDEARQALVRYREEVDQHFLRTADTVNQLTSAYKAVHEQLADGARKLCSEQGRRLALARSLDLLPGSDEQVGEEVRAPLDYAPSHKGTLAEDFGHGSKDDTLAAYDHWEQEEGSDHSPPRDYADGCDEQGCPPDGDKQQA